MAAFLLTMLFLLLALLAVGGLLFSHRMLRLTNGVLAVMTAIMFCLFVLDHPQVLANYMLIFLFSMVAVGYLWPTFVADVDRLVLRWLSTTTRSPSRDDETPTIHTDCVIVTSPTTTKRVQDG